MPLENEIRQGVALLPPQMGIRPARVLLYAINLQENPKRYEQQVGGPANLDWSYPEQLLQRPERPGRLPHLLACAFGFRNQHARCLAQGLLRIKRHQRLI